MFSIILLSFFQEKINLVKLSLKNKAFIICTLYENKIASLLEKVKQP